MKARTAAEAKTLTDIPNIGPAIARDFKMIGVDAPYKLKSQEPYALYTKLNKKTGTRHDPCVLDVFMSAVDFMNGAPPRPWWHYTRKRKKNYPDI